MSLSFLLVKMNRFLSRNSIYASLFLAVILLSCPFDSAAQIRLAWDPNTETDVAGYKIYYGTASRNYGYSINVGNVTTYTLMGLMQGVTYYIALTAYDSASNESAYSNEVSGTVTETISPPTVLNGPTTGTTGQPYTYTTGGSSSTLGHAVQYQFDWKGDGSDLSPWGSATQSKTWALAGTYNVRGRARCVTHTSVVSAWLGVLPVNITNGQPTVSIVATDNIATEAGPTTGTFTVSRTGSTAASLTVYYTVSGTSTGGVDRISLSGARLIPAGSSSATITITPIDDALCEGDETVIVTLRAGTAYTVGTPNNATITIISDD